MAGLSDGALQFRILVDLQGKTLPVNHLPSRIDWLSVTA